MQLYHQALGREPEQREDFVREACDGDADLCQEVERYWRTIVRATTGSDGMSPSLMQRIALPYRLMAPRYEGAVPGGLAWSPKRLARAGLETED